MRIVIGARSYAVKTERGEGECVIAARSDEIFPCEKAISMPRGEVRKILAVRWALLRRRVGFRRRKVERVEEQLERAVRLAAKRHLAAHQVELAGAHRRGGDGHAVLQVSLSPRPAT